QIKTCRSFVKLCLFKFLYQIHKLLASLYPCVSSLLYRLSSAWEKVCASSRSKNAFLGEPMLPVSPTTSPLSRRFFYLRTSSTLIDAPPPLTSRHCVSAVTIKTGPFRPLLYLAITLSSGSVFLPASF